MAPAITRPTARTFQSKHGSISVADVFDLLTSDRPYRKAMSPYEVREILTKGSGTEFDPKVVTAFLSAFSRVEMEVPALLV